MRINEEDEEMLEDLKEDFKKVFGKNGKRTLH